MAVSPLGKLGHSYTSGEFVDCPGLRKILPKETGKVLRTSGKQADHVFLQIQTAYQLPNIDKPENGISSGSFIVVRIRDESACKNNSLGTQFSLPKGTAKWLLLKALLLL
jgi:hypothetical protein